MVLTKEQAEARVQELLAAAKTAIDEVTALAKQFKLEPSFMGQTFRLARSNYFHDRDLPLRSPDWYDDEYWMSSTAGCEVGVIYPDEEEP